jgi:hypothetical protein
MGAYAYLAGSLALALAALASCLLAPVQVRRHSARVLLLSLPFALVSLDYGNYWHPHRLGGLNLGLEDFLLSAASGILLWNLPYALAARRAQFGAGWPCLLRRYAAVTVAGAALVGLARATGASPSHSLAAAMFLLAAALAAGRPAYRLLVLAGALSFLTLYLAVLLACWRFFPQFSAVWNWAGLSGLRVAGIPFEEIAWAAGYGAVWPAMMAFAFRATPRPVPGD